MSRNQKQLVATMSMVHANSTVAQEDNSSQMGICIVVAIQHVVLVALVVVTYSVVIVTKAATILIRRRDQLQQCRKMLAKKS